MEMPGAGLPNITKMTILTTLDELAQSNKDLSRGVISYALASFRGGHDISHQPEEVADFVRKNAWTDHAGNLHDEVAGIIISWVRERD
jgi:hypothetical protein